MTDTDEASVDTSAGAGAPLLAGIGAAVVIGAGLSVTARLGAADLLAAVAVVQALAVAAVVVGLQLPGRKGVVLIGALAAGGADVVVSVWPHSRLGTLLAVVGLAVPVLIGHQLLRGAARSRVLDSLGGSALVVLVVAALPALVQLRHEFVSVTTAGRVVFGVVVSLVAALVVAALVDLVVPAPRFDTDVSRGLLGVVAAGLAGAVVGYLTLRDTVELAGGRGLFVGASLGVLAALLAVGVALADASAPTTATTARRVRPVLQVVVPISVLAPVAFLLCLAIRS